MIFLALTLACGSVAPPVPQPPEAAASPPPAPPARPGLTRPTEGWVDWAPGISVAVFAAPNPSFLGDSQITMVRVDPKRRQLRLVGGFLDGPGMATAREWAEVEGLDLAFNASMFREDYRTSVHGMRGYGRTNNPHRGDARTMLVFDPLRAGPAAARILDESCEDPDAVGADYGVAIAGIRMLSCTGKNVWGRSDKAWSHAAIGEDRDGNILFLHARSPWPTRDFIANAQALVPELVNLQYAEGGPEAQLFLRGGPEDIELVGSYETGFYERDDNRRAWPIPNVVGVNAL